MLTIQGKQGIVYAEIDLAPIKRRNPSREPLLLAEDSVQYAELRSEPNPASPDPTPPDNPPDEQSTSHPIGI